MPKHDYSKEPYDDKGNYRIRDNTIGKWVTNGVGRQVRRYENEVDDIIEELEERTDDDG
jgi:hypothetical protein